MEQITISQLAQFAQTISVAAIAIYGWLQERRERQAKEESFAKEREGLMSQVIDLAREAYGLQPISRHYNSVPAPPRVDPPAPG